MITKDRVCVEIELSDIKNGQLIFPIEIIGIKKDAIQDCSNLIHIIVENFDVDFSYEHISESKNCPLLQFITIGAITYNVMWYYDMLLQILSTKKINDIHVFHVQHWKNYRTDDIVPPFWVAHKGEYIIDGSTLKEVVRNLENVSKCDVYEKYKDLTLETLIGVIDFKCMIPKTCCFGIDEFLEQSSKQLYEMGKKNFLEEKITVRDVIRLLEEYQDSGYYYNEIKKVIQSFTSFIASIYERRSKERDREMIKEMRGS